MDKVQYWMAPIQQQLISYEGRWTTSISWHINALNTC